MKQTMVQVETIKTLIVGRPLRLLIAWSMNMEEEGACLAAALGSHLSAGRVMVREVATDGEENFLQIVSQTPWDCVFWLGQGNLTQGVKFFCDKTPWVVLQDGGDGSRDEVAEAARQVLRQGVGQSLAMAGRMPIKQLMMFWSAFFRGLLVDGILDLPRATAVGQAAMAESLQDNSWQGIMTFSRLASDGTVEMNRVHLLPLKDPRFLHAGERVRGINGREIFRYGLWNQVEEAFSTGQRMVGLVGPAGAGKSVMAHLLMERLHRHPQLSEEGRRVVWLNAGIHGGAPSLWQHLADLFAASGFHADPHWVGQQTSPSAIQLALMFKRLMGAHGWLVVDQCHATQLAEGGWQDPEMASLLTALLTQTGWRCLLTSRKPFELCRESQLCAVQWISMPPLTWTERAALCIAEQEVFSTPEPILAMDRLLHLVWQGDIHPLHVRLSLREAVGAESMKDADDDRLKALLQGLLAEAEPAVGMILQVLSLLHFVPEVSQLGGIWRVLGAKAGWRQEMYAIHMGQLEALGLVEIMASGRVWMASSVREWVANSVPAEAKKSLQRDLALLFYQFSENIMNEASSLQPVTQYRGEDEEGELPEVLVQKAKRMLNYALQHALQQEDFEVIAIIFQDVLEQQGATGYRGRLFRQGLDFWQILECASVEKERGTALSAAFGVAGKVFLMVEDMEWANRALQRAMAVLPEDAPAPLAGGLYYQLGLLHQSVKEWQNARQALQQALHHFQLAKHTAGIASINRALRHLADKEAREG